MGDPARYGHGYPDDDDGLPAGDGWVHDCEQKAQHWTERITDLMKGWFGGDAEPHGLSDAGPT